MDTFLWNVHYLELKTSIDIMTYGHKRRRLDGCGLQSKGYKYFKGIKQLRMTHMSAINNLKNISDYNSWKEYLKTKSRRCYNDINRSAQDICNVWEREEMERFSPCNQNRGRS